MIWTLFGWTIFSIVAGEWKLYQYKKYLVKKALGTYYGQSVWINGQHFYIVPGDEYLKKILKGDMP